MRSFAPSDFWYILLALRWTVLLSLAAFCGGGLVGLLTALARTGSVRIFRVIATGYIHLFRGTPLLLQLFLTFFGAPVIGIEVDPWTAAVVALTLNAGAFLGEIWRGCIQAVPPGQWEAGAALGLSYFNRMRDVILPQALKVAIPPTVGYLVQVIKGTSLAAIIGFTELTRAGQIINNATFQPMIVFSVVASLYFILCWPLSLVAARMERRLAVSQVRS